MKRFSRHVACFFLVLSMQGRALAFNSEEHKVIGDTGASRVQLPPGTRLTAGVALEDVDKTQYIQMFKSAKKLAVGFDTNSPADYDSTKPGIQDHCYYTSYGQMSVDMGLHIPSEDEVPGKNLFVTANVNPTPSRFTFGELVAFYGDYRRTNYCDDQGQCYLTDGDIDGVSFPYDIRYAKPLISGVCPEKVQNETYLRYIASGLVPPFGAKVNATGRTATDTAYGEAGWWGDDLSRLLNGNDWHFAAVGLSYYVGLHRLALHYVQLAIERPEFWNAALHYEANALHSLTDAFAFGHLVTNRDVTSYNILKNNSMNGASLLAATPTVWQEGALTTGGAIRMFPGTAQDGRISATALFDPIDWDGLIPAVRNDFMPSYQSLNLEETYGLYSKIEHDFHDFFNKGTDGFVDGKGARMKNLNGDEFRTYGDGLFFDMFENDREPIYAAVQASVQSLFDAQVALRNGMPLDQIAAAGTPFYKALTYIPIYVFDGRDDYFLGRYIISAEAIDQIAGTHYIEPMNGVCTLPYLWGAESYAKYFAKYPDKDREPCANAFSTVHNVPFRVPGKWLNSSASTELGGNQSYKFKVDAAGRIAFKLASGVRSRLYLYDSDGRLLERRTGNLGEQQTDSYMERTLAPGEYKVVAATALENQSGDFTLTVSDHAICEE